MELWLREWRARNPIPRDLESATEHFFESMRDKDSDMVELGIAVDGKQPKTACKPLSLAPVDRFVQPHIVGPIAESYMVERTHERNREWLTPERTWDRSIFEAARFELDEREKAEWWLNRELLEAKQDKE
jgi:hypothetical protein